MKNSFSNEFFIRAVGLSLTLACAGAPAFASSYIVSNGDDGGDLEGGKKITSGILIETREKALERLRNLNIPSVDHLGTLIPELEKSDVYLVPRDVKAKINADHGMESSKESGDVYARTFAEPHAATRFFPSALTLNSEQLVALHIHEALHRALPPAVRESETVVTKITLALTASDANLDRVRRVVKAEVGSPSEAPTTAGGPAVSSRSELKLNESALHHPSSVTYTYRSFFIPRDGTSSYPIDSLHSLQTVFYPLGTKRRALGLGMEFSYLTLPGQAFMGPLTLSARLRLANLNDYEVSGFASLSLNTMAGDQIKNSPLGRDVTTAGVSFRRDVPRYYIEDSLSLSFEGEARRKTGSTSQLYRYGKVLAASIHAGGKVRGFELGGFAEVLLADFYRQNGPGNSETDASRFRILGMGPEFSYIKGAMRYSANARWVVDSPSGMSLDEIGDLVGYGVGQGSVSLSVSLQF